ncbi:MAG TPA: hypothetical protein ENH82_00035 [bacterium]|nr:hypothetical protein [bacterium]
MIDTVKRTKQSYFPKNISRDQIKDTGMAMVLICLLIGVIGNNGTFFKVAIAFLLIKTLIGLKHLA